MDKKEPSFPHFSELPLELSSMVVDDMRGDDKWRFSGCSKLSNKEVKSSKNCIYEMIFKIFAEYRIQIGMNVGIRSNFFNRACHSGYLFEFKKRSGKNFMICKRKTLFWREPPKVAELWRVKLSNSMSLVNHAVEYFNNLLQVYQHSVRKLVLKSEITQENFRFDMKIDKLKNLEDLHVEGSFNALQFISKAKHPLKKLRVLNDGNHEIPMDEIYKIQKDLWLPHLKLNYEQFLQISASETFTHLGELTLDNIYHLIRTWQYGTVRGKRTFCWYWNARQIFRDNSFDAAQLFRRFGKHDYMWISCETQRLAHSERTGSYATLLSFNNAIGLVLDHEAYETPYVDVIYLNIRVLDV